MFCVMNVSSSDTMYTDCNLRVFTKQNLGGVSFNGCQMISRVSNL